MAGEKLIEVRKLYKIFRTDEVETTAVNNVSFTIAQGEYVAISGPSGGGKSTVLSLLGLLDSPTSGEYYFKGSNTANLSKQQLGNIRNNEIGFVFQAFNLIEDMSVMDNVMLPLVYRRGHSGEALKQLALETLDKVGMSHRVKHYPVQLSGGQQQRVAIARAIITKPSLILADEPTGNLDSKSAEDVMQLLREQHLGGATVCIVTHDARHTVDATRTIKFADGSIEA